MENKEIIQKAILKAEKNGYKGHLDYCPLFLKRKPDLKKKLTKKELMDLVSELWLRHINEIIFSHDFAKAYFLDKWQQMLQNMVIKKNPLKFLEKYL